jgi:hypothetical protein
MWDPPNGPGPGHEVQWAAGADPRRPGIELRTSSPTGITPTRAPGSSGRPPRNDPDIPDLLLAFRMNWAAEIERDLVNSDPTTDHPSGHTVVAAEPLDFSKKCPGDFAPENAGLSSLELDHEHRSRLTSLPDRPAHEPQEQKRDGEMHVEIPPPAGTGEVSRTPSDPPQA